MAVLTKNLIIYVSDAKISSDVGDILVTYSLGSCIAVTLYDPVRKIGGMIHYQLPASSMDPQRAVRDPFMFADTGIKLLLDSLVNQGAEKRRLAVKIAGGAAMDNGPKGFDIGNRNILAARKILWQYGLMLKGQDVGGNYPRNMYLSIDDGTVIIKSNSQENTL